VEVEARGQVEGFGGGGWGGFNIEGAAAVGAVEVVVAVEVGAVAGGAAFVVDLADEAALGEGIEAIVDGSDGDLGHGIFGADEDILGGRVVVVVEEGEVDEAALGGKAEAGTGEALVEAGVWGVGQDFGCRRCRRRHNRGGK
jgi:hypothetical protein